MDKYYYMISQLPVLFFDKETYMTIEFFLEEAQKWLNRRDYAVLSRIELDDTSLDRKGPGLWKEYKLFEFRLRSELALWRKSLREEQEYKPSGFSVSMLKEGNPLEVEKKLLRHRWNFIEEMEQEHHFDLGFLILYFLKLQILRRLSLFNKEKGMEIFKEIVTTQLLK